MRYLFLITLSSCGFFYTSDGLFNGKIVDVSWEGWIWKSCEVQFQFGEQSSSLSQGFTRNTDLCDTPSWRIINIR